MQLCTHLHSFLIMKARNFHSLEERGHLHYSHAKTSTAKKKSSVPKPKQSIHTTLGPIFVLSYELIQTRMSRCGYFSGLFLSDSMQVPWGVFDSLIQVHLGVFWCFPLLLCMEFWTKNLLCFFKGLQTISTAPLSEISSLHWNVVVPNIEKSPGLTTPGLTTATM